MSTYHQAGRQNMEDVREGQRGSSVNCTTEELLLFAEEVGRSRLNFIHVYR